MLGFQRSDTIRFEISTFLEALLVCFGDFNAFYEKNDSCAVVRLLMVPLAPLCVRHGRNE